MENKYVLMFLFFNVVSGQTTYHFTANNFNGNLENEIALGDIIYCNSTPPNNTVKRLVVQHYDFPSTCDDLHVDYQLHVDVDHLYWSFSPLGYEKWGSIQPFMENSHFAIKLITINKDFKQGMNGLLKALNLDSNKPVLYILVITRLNFTSKYHKLLFQKILESRQIIHIITMEDPVEALSIDYTVVNDSVVLVGQFHGMSNFTLQLDTVTYTKYFNVISNVRCNYPICFKDCIGKTDSQDFCISYDVRNLEYDDDIIRHFKYHTKYLGHPRNKRTVPPDWFLSWLESRSELIADAGLNPNHPTGTRYGVLFGDSGKILLDSQTSTEVLPTIHNIIISQNNITLPLFNLAQCYHGIVVGKLPYRPCIKYAVYDQETNL